jgi:hypothetical protein
MNMGTKSVEQKLREEFSNYERTVWTVNSIEGHLRKHYSDLLKCFDRYPRLPRPDRAPLTPDFCVVFQGPYALVGEVKRALGLDQVSITTRYAQLKGYDEKLHLRSAPGGAYDYESDSHDILLFINLEYAKKEAKKLSELIAGDRKLGHFQRAVSVFGATYDSQQAKAKWIFTWIESSGESLRDTNLPVARRLSKRHQEDGEAIVVYTDEFAGLQAVHHFCNDEPPDVYLAVLLWSRVFPKLITRDRREPWVDADCQGVVEIDVTAGDLAKYATNQLGYGVKTEGIRKVLDLLVKADLADHGKAEEFKINYRRFRIRRGEEESDEAFEEAKLDHVKEGIIRALTQTEKKPAGRVRFGRTRRTAKDDKHQLPLL